MKGFLASCVMVLAMYNSQAQTISRIPDSARNRMERDMWDRNEKKLEADEEWVKNKLVSLALKNPLLAQAEANVQIANINRKKANSTLLGAVSAGANINEFVFNNSAAANFFPKYNIGLSIPLDLFAKNKTTKQVADQNILLADAIKAQQTNYIKADVLARYENYKEKKELVELQKISMENDLIAYQSAQKDYAEGTLKLVEMNKFYQSYINAKAYLISREKDLNVAVIQLEEIIGVPLNEALEIKPKKK